MIKLLDIVNEARPYKGGESKYTNDSIIAAAKKAAEKGSSYEEFKKEQSGVYYAAKIRNLLDTIRQFFPGARKYYTDQDIIKAAKESEYLEDFKRDHFNLYQTAVSRGIWKDVEKLLKRREERLERDRIVYAYTFPEEINEEGETVKYAYIGLTAREKSRSREHSKTVGKYDTAVYKHQLKSGNKPTYEVLSDGYVSEDEARRQEDYYIEEYRKNGWLLLNTRPGGSLGGWGKKVYSDEDLADIALKYDTLNDFDKHDHSAYNLARKRGIFDTITKHMTRKRVDYSEDSLCTICKKADKEGKHLKAYDENAYAAARRAAKKQGISVGEFINNCLGKTTITESVDDKEILRRTINGFELVPAKFGFGHPYVTKNGKATRDLATRINAWIQKEFPYSDIETKFDPTYYTLNFFKR